MAIWEKRVEVEVDCFLYFLVVEADGYIGE
jgi:hypothetical protein